MKLNLAFFYKVSFLEKFFFVVIFSLLILSIFVGIPSDVNNIGISSNQLNIGDRDFYINNTSMGFGYEDFSGNILYPLILKFITSVSNLFNQDQYSKLWNLIAIFITSVLSIITLSLLRNSTLKLFNKNVAEIACLLFILNPYTYYYSLSGGLVNYLLFGVTFILWIFSRSINAGYKLTDSIQMFDIFGLSLGCIYLSFLRPSGCIFAFCILFFLCFKNIKNKIINHKFNSIKFINLVILVASLVIVIYNINYSLKYSIVGINEFVNEGGLYFGYPRDILRSKLELENFADFENLKRYLYFFLWKITDFVSGMSDIRDTHNASNLEQIFPFLIRTFTGIFILFPINLFAFLGIIFNFKFIFKTDLWLIIIASIFALSPSLIGVAMSRYLLMFYTPFIVFSSKMIFDTFKNMEITKN